MKPKKNPLYSNCSFQKKNLKLFVSIFQTFSRSGKLLDKFQDFFKNSRLCTKPVRKASALLATLSFRVRLGPCFAELYYGSVLRMLSLLLLVVTRLRRKLGQNSFPKRVPSCILTQDEEWTVLLNLTNHRLTNNPLQR